MSKHLGQETIFCVKNKKDVLGSFFLFKKKMGVGLKGREGIIRHGIEFLLINNNNNIFSEIL